MDGSVEPFGMAVGVEWRMWAGPRQQELLVIRDDIVGLVMVLSIEMVASRRAIEIATMYPRNASLEEIGNGTADDAAVHIA